MKEISQSDIDILALVEDAVIGKVSENGPECFDSYYRVGNGEKMMADFRAVMDRLGVCERSC